MAKERPVEISVATVFDSKRDDRQAFIELILHKRKMAAKSGQPGIDAVPPDRYTDGKVFSDVRVG